MEILIFMLDLEVILLSSTEITLIINKGSLKHHSFKPNMINDLCVWMQYFVKIWPRTDCQTYIRTDMKVNITTWGNLGQRSALVNIVSMSFKL